MEEYYHKRQKVQYKEASELVRLYRERYGRDADEKALHEFFWLFTSNTENLPACWKDMMDLIGNSELSYTKLNENQPKYKSMDDFLKSIK